MKTQDLMIGDWVTFADALKDGAVVPIQITGLGYSGFTSGKIDNSEGWDVLDVEDLAGIPITQELLERNGFWLIRDKHAYAFYSIATDYYDLHIDEVSDSIWCLEYHNTEARFPTCRVLIGYLHELQHALRLCGVEKEITV